MNRNRKWLQAVLLAGCLLYTGCAGDSVESGKDRMQTAADVPENRTVSWKLKSVDGVLCKRPWDEVNGCWLGEWIPV